ncbi:hypothetical protein PanWU01x14_227730 [Parasponia andersonii]|uniref:Uncharacterized protein n=1 Tax=Parasponia andersonii TaxID=3476 RepID=A0A2P5BLR7_PARAD|nr:hypothetical protein PanWU01x14_227730 [Parasponia andersonii]
MHYSRIYAPELQLPRPIFRLIIVKPQTQMAKPKDYGRFLVISLGAGTPKARRSTMQLKQLSGVLWDG